MRRRLDWADYRAPEYASIDPMRTIAILPTAAIEQHGPHLPVGTDTLISEGLLDRLRSAGLVISALTQREQLTEIVELPHDVHPWFVGVQFHPEFRSTPWNGHPLFNAFVRAALDHQSQGRNLKAVA